MSDKSKAVVGVFTYLDDALSAIRYAKEAGKDYLVYSPVPHHEIEEATMPEKSPVRFFTATGATIGLCSGFALAILCSMDWPLRVSAKDVVSIPGFFVIGYECTILFGALATLTALLHFCRLPHIFRRIGYDPRFSNDKFGVVVACSTGEVEEVTERMKSSGADEVDVKNGL